MIISFDIPNAKLTRLGEALEHLGYVYNPALGTSDAVQKQNFLKEKTIEFWKSLTESGERLAALKAANDSAVPVDLSDVS